METCSTSDAAFVDYGVPHGSGLASATYFRLVETGDGEFEPTPAFFDRLARAFRLAFVRRADVPVVPEPVDAAVEDALAPTAHEFVDSAARSASDGRKASDAGDVDLREDVVPAFLSRVARYTCAYLPAFPNGGAGVAWRDDRR